VSVSVITYIVPCYNESDRLEEFKSQFKELIEIHNFPVNLIMVNDGSKDNTADVISSICNELSSEFKGLSFDVVSYTDNKGKGNALYKGIAACKTKWCLTIDADCATKPVQLKNWVEEYGINFSETAIYIGNREEGHEMGIVNSSLLRRTLGIVFNFYVKLLTVLKMRDTQCGFKLYPTETALKAFESLTDYGFGHDVEVLIKISKMGIPIHSLPVRWEAVSGSKINLITDGFNMLKHVMKIASKYR